MECKAFKYNYTVEVLPTRINMTNEEQDQIVYKW